MIEGGFASGDIIKMLITNTGFPGLIKMNVGITNVDDCALAHYKAVTVP